jgi:hypothetical protein
MKKLFTILSISLLLGCGSTKTIKYNDVDKRDFIIIGVKGSGTRNFTVDLQDVRNKKKYAYRLYRVNDKVTLKLATYKVEGRQYEDFIDIKKVMCK